MKKLILVTVLSSIVLLFIANACTHQVTKTRNVPNYVTVQEPYTVTETVSEQVQLEVPHYGLRPPYFPNINKSKINIAVLPFSSSAGGSGYGEEVSNELEFRLMKRTEKFKKIKRGDLRAEFESATRDLCVDVDIFDKWYRQNKVEKYQILSRDRINAILTENNLGQDARTIQKNAKLIGVDCLITGHVKEIDEGRTSFIMKAIIPHSGRVIFTERYENQYEEAFTEAVNSFYFNIKRVGNGYCDNPEGKKFETVSKQVERTEYRDKKEKRGTREEEYKVKETDWLATILLIILIAAVA